MTSAYSHIGPVIKALRRERKMTQSELAAGICSRSYISLVEKGQVTPSPDIVKRLAERLGIDHREIGIDGTKTDLADLLASLKEAVEEKRWGCVETLLQHMERKGNDAVQHPLYLLGKGTLAEEQRLYPEAEQYYRASVDLAQSMNMLEAHVRALDSLGALLCRNGHSGNPADAAPFFNRALQLVADGNVNGRVKISLFVNTGLMYLRLAEYNAAARYLFEAEQLNEAFRTDFRLDYIYNGLGVYCAATRQYELAEHYIKQAIRLYERDPKDANVLIGSYTNLSIMYRLTFRYEEAILYLQKANELAKSIGFDYAVQNTSIELAKVLRKVGRCAEAKDLCRNIIRIGKDDTMAESQFVLAELLLDEGNETEAVQLLEQSLQGFRRKSMNLFLPKVYHLLGQLYYRQGDFERAAQMYQQCCAITMSEWEKKASI